MCAPMCDALSTASNSFKTSEFIVVDKLLWQLCLGTLENLWVTSAHCACYCKLGLKLIVFAVAWQVYKHYSKCAKGLVIAWGHMPVSRSLWQY